MKLPSILFLALAATGIAGAADVVKPNVILMMADDMGMGDTSAFQDYTGNADEVQVDTPSMEKLARLGVRFTDAHTPSSRCSPTRYGLLTGRYPWRNRLKHWVLFGNQGDPMIEKDRPTLATMFRDEGYTTAMTGKWHVGLRYSRADGSPAAAWADADITRPLSDAPVDHGFELARYTSRSHGTSGPDAGSDKKNGSNQTVGPGHLHERTAVAASGDGKALIREGENAYVLTKLGSRFSNMSVKYLETHLAGGENEGKPFFLYYPSPSNHGPYTPDEGINGKPATGASRTKKGEPMDLRHDYIYENDLILGRFIDWLEANDDPRHPGKKLIETTVVIFTSDNGAEKNTREASGPFRSNKGSTYEGGHRVPYIVSWPDGNVGDGDASTPGETNVSPICHTDIYATFSEIIGHQLPDPANGEKGAEDSFSILKAWQGEVLHERPPMFAHDHKEAKDDPAVSALRLDSPTVNGEKIEGQWKLFFDASLLRMGRAVPIELYDLASDQMEENNRVSDPEMKSLVKYMSEMAMNHRNIGGHRLAYLDVGREQVFEFKPEMKYNFADGKLSASGGNVAIFVEFSDGKPSFNRIGMGASSGAFEQVDGGETLLLSFDRDVVVQNVAIVAGNGQCGGFYQVGDKSPLAIYCIDAAIDMKDQSGVLSDIGVLKEGDKLLLSSAPHYGVEDEGRWRLRSVSVRPLK
jgi:arylsulfatase A